MKTFIFEDICELMDHEELGFAEALLSSEEYRNIKGDFYGSFRKIRKVPQGELMSDDDLNVYLAACYQFLLKMAHPDKKFKVAVVDGGRMSVEWTDTD